MLILQIQPAEHLLPFKEMQGLIYSFQAERPERETGKYNEISQWK